MTEATPRPWRFKTFVSHDPDVGNSGWGNIWGNDEVMRLASVGGGVGAMGNYEANAALIVRAVNAHEALVEALGSLIEAFDSGNLEMNSPEIGGDDPEIQPRPWHEEWLHHALAALTLAKGEAP